MNQYYDNTMLTDYKNCPRYFYLRHHRGWKPGSTAMPLVFGLGWHEAMDVIWSGYGKLPNDALVEVAMHAFEETWIAEGCKPFSELTLQDFEILGARTPMVAKEMLHCYLDKREDILTNMELVSTEKPFAVPLYPDRPDLWYIGRRDKDIKLNGDRIVIEHKTTTEYKQDGGFKTQYIESFYPNSQVEGYLYSANMEYGDVRYVWADAALVHKKVHDAFRFIPVSATTSALDAWLWEARDWISRIESEMERLVDAECQRVLTAFPRATNNCVGKYGLCSMLPVCRSYLNPAQVQDAPPGYVYEPWKPFDILKIADLGMKE